MLGADAKGERSAEACFLPGQLIDGKYRVERLIGVGGMAAVWAGSNERTGKRVALKAALRSLASAPGVRELFYTEGLVASRVNHPNVVTIFDVIEHEGMTCMVMELLDGEPLSRFLERKGRLTVHEATWLLLPAMRGVAAAHAQGAIHRDLKPQNIFLCVEPTGRIVTTKVLDFGISIMVERVLDLSRGLLLGTPNYMSPEHLAGEAIIDGRADVYGFGLLLYETLTGQMAFPGEAGPTLFHAIMKQPAPPVTAQRPDIPSGMASIIARSMAKQPEKRFASLNAMITAVEAELLALGLGVSAPSALPGPLQAGVMASPAAPIHQETMVLHALPSQTTTGRPESVREPLAGGALVMNRHTDTEVVRRRSGRLAQRAGLDSFSHLQCKVGLATVLGVVLGIAAWKVTGPNANIEVLQTGSSAQVTPVSPTVVPLQVPEPVVVPVIAEPEPEVWDSGFPEKAAPAVQKKGSRARPSTASSSTQAGVGPGRGGAAEARVRGRARVVPEAGASTVRRDGRTRPSSPRAGSLSTEDF